MAKLHDLFTDIQAQCKSYLGGQQGKEFEDRIETNLKKIGFTRVLPRDFKKNEYQKLKKEVLDKESDVGIPNTYTSLKSHFLNNPFGSQRYPDFLVFEGEKIISVEVKFSSQNQKKPVWNSGLPRPNGIYIFGSYKHMDATFFRGCDVLNLSEVNKLHRFFDNDLRKLQKTFNSREMEKQPYGFQTYVRKAFDQTKTPNSDAIINFFTNPNRKKLESNVLNYLDNSTPSESE